MYFDDEGDLKEYGGKTGLLQRRAAKWRSRVLRWAVPASSNHAISAAAAPHNPGFQTVIFL